MYLPWIVFYFTWPVSFIKLSAPHREIAISPMNKTCNLFNQHYFILTLIYYKENHTLFDEIQGSNTHSGSHNNPTLK